MRGALIVLEGCDRVGKTTQCKKLIDKIAAGNGESTLLKFPERSSDIGQVIDKYLRDEMELNDKVIHLLFSANRWETESKMKRLLMSGTHLIVDRYAFSGAAYSAAKGLDIEWCRSPDVGLPRPDLVLFLDLDTKTATSRCGYGEERYEKHEFQEKVRQNFFQLKDESWKIVDARKTAEEMHEEIWKSVREVMDLCQNKPIGQLWC